MVEGLWFEKIGSDKGVNLNCLDGRILFFSSPLIEEAVWVFLKKKKQRAA